ncbi:hypothetical protein GCM10028796_40460 [Ramlibacter monticola]
MRADMKPRHRRSKADTPGGRATTGASQVQVEWPEEYAVTIAFSARPAARRALMAPAGGRELHEVSDRGGSCQPSARSRCSLLQ